MIREVFSKNIVNGPGMEKVYSVIDKPIIPTPAAVMLATELFSQVNDDVIVVDIGEQPPMSIPLQTEIPK